MSKYNFWLTVNVTDIGDVEYECGQCDRKWTVPIKKSNSVFWDVFNGLTVLEALGHFQAAHMKGADNGAT